MGTAGVYDAIILDVFAAPRRTRCSEVAASRGDTRTGAMGGTEFEVRFASDAPRQV